MEDGSSASPEDKNDALHAVFSARAEIKALNGKNEALNDENKALNDENKALNDENKALNGKNEALNGKNEALNERLILAKSQDDMDVIKARIARNDAQVADNRAQIARNDAQIVDNRAQIARNDAQIARLDQEIRDAKALQDSTRQLAVLDLGQRFKEFNIVSKGASDFCASKDNVFGPCCLTSSVCLSCGLPPCVRRTMEAETPSEDVKEARQAILDGVAQLPFTCHKLSETKKSVTVDRVTGGALEAFFVNRSGSGLSWFRSTNALKKVLGDYAPHGFASSGSTPDGVWCTSDGLVPLAILELKDTALDPFDAFGQAVSEGSNCVMRQLNAGLSWDQCRVLFVCCNGSKYLFGFVALLEPRFIHAGPLSPVLDVTLPVAMDEAARLLVVIRQACLEQQQLLRTANRPAAVAETFRLSVERYHLKPAERVLLQHKERDHAAGWCRFLHVYDQIFSCAEIREHVVFPLGFSNDLGGKLEGVLFPRLDSTWSIGLPDDANNLELFVGELVRVLKVLHTEAGFVHGDCCPCNIAWKVRGSEVHVKLLDLDTAVEIGARLPDALLNAKTTLGKEYGFHSAPGECSPVAVAETDLWYSFLFSQTPAEFRASCAVDMQGGPAFVNAPFRTWVSRNVESLRENFARWLLKNKK